LKLKLRYQHFVASTLLFIIFSCTIDGQNLEEDPIIGDLIYDYGIKGYYYLDNNLNLDTAEYYVKEALRLQYSTNNYKIDDRVAANHISLASFYRRIYNYPEAIRELNKAEEILANDPDNLYFVNIYHNKGNLYRLVNDLYRTKEYYEYALDFVKEHGSQNTTRFAHVFANLVNLLFDLGEYEEARRYLSEIDITTLNMSPSIEFRILLTTANSYAELNEYELARSYYRKVNRLIENQRNNELNNLIIDYYARLIDFYIQYGEYDNALSEVDRGFLFIESLNNRSTRNKAEYQSAIIKRSAIIYYNIGDIERALRVTNQGIILLNDFFEELNLVDSKNAINIYSSNLPDLYMIKSRILLEKFQDSNSIEDLKDSYESYQTSIEILNTLKLAMQDENSRVYATSQVLEIYKEAIYVGKLLYDLTDDINYLEKSFEFAESSKSFALFSEIKDMEAIEFSDLPSEVKAREDRLVGQIQYYEGMLYQEQLEEIPDSNKISIYKDQLFHLNDDYDDLMNGIEENNSKYYNLKYNPKFVTLQEVQDQLPFKEALIEYVLTDSILITYVIDRKGINVFSQEIGLEFSDECMEYYELLRAQNFSNGVHRDYRRFIELGRKFFQILVEPSLQYTDRKIITIVPDGAITYLPFEGFLTEEADNEYINYMTLPYVIRDFSIGYSHSSTLKFSKRLKTKSPERKVLAFAPKYRDLGTYADLGTQYRQPVENNEILLPLRGIIKEVQSINETVPSRIFLNEKATEANFKKFASDYNVLHLAMHTIMRDDEPLLSHLAFTNVVEEDTVEDNKLYAYEIYNMKLNAQMAVLSSCSSGFGKMQKGEGMMSLARGFTYAGCPSIIMTLWQVSDQSSSELMTSFYKFLKKGKSKQESMRLAKLKYLESADDLTSNPYFWSGFVVVGDGNPIYRKSGLAYWMVIVTVFVGLLLFVQYRKS
jgi:CHAT domain-containing protein